jgi:hypothetical protein
MQPYYEYSGAGIDIWAGGESIIESRGGLKKQSETYLNDFPDLRKIFLIWSGEIKNDTEGFQQIRLTPAGKKTVMLKADKMFKTGSSGAFYSSCVIYSCIADITPYYNGKGKYMIEGIKSDPSIKKPSNDQFSVAGYAVLVVYARDDKAIHKVRVYAGLDVLSPGEMHTISILDKGTDLSLNKIAIIGGHGRKGNGSSNLLNGTGISLSEDWDASSGPYWDVDVFDNVNVDRSIETVKGLVLTFDTVLQWIYPVAVAAVFKEGG